MEMNSLIFPSPEPSYTLNQFGLIFIPKFEEKKEQSSAPKTGFDKFKGYFEKVFKPPEESPKIPCFTITYVNEKEGGSKNLLLYFHGNAEDTAYAYDFLDAFSDYLKVNVLAIEYPGYGVYPGVPKAEKIEEDSLIVYDYLTKKMNIEEKNIFLVGRSIGTGPATFLAARRNPGALILISPYTSIRKVVKDLAGSVLQYTVAERFKNIQEIEKVNCPIFLIHGKQDNIIPFSHSKDLYCKTKNGKCDFWFPNDMDHNKYDMLMDLLIPVENFFKKNKYEIITSEEFIMSYPEETLDPGEFLKKFPGNKSGYMKKIYEKFID